MLGTEGGNAYDTHMTLAPHLVIVALDRPQQRDKGFLRRGPLIPPDQTRKLVLHLAVGSQNEASFSARAFWCFIFHSNTLICNFFFLIIQQASPDTTHEHRDARASVILRYEYDHLLCFATTST